jgi:hypothetical protein
VNRYDSLLRLLFPIWALKEQLEVHRRKIDLFKFSVFSSKDIKRDHLEKSIEVVSLCVAWLQHVWTKYLSFVVLGVNPSIARFWFDALVEADPTPQKTKVREKRCSQGGRIRAVLISFRRGERKDLSRSNGSILRGRFCIAWKCRSNSILQKDGCPVRSSLCAMSRRCCRRNP